MPVWSKNFEPPSDTSVPLLILEASNDPLVEESLREQLKGTYPQAEVVTVDNGHFPYISDPQGYTEIISNFFEQD